MRSREIGSLLSDWIVRIRRTGFRLLWRLGWKPKSVPIQSVLKAILRQEGIPVGEEGRVRFFRGDLGVVLVGDPAAVYKVVQFGFYKGDGGIYVESPYFAHKVGAIAAFTRDPSRIGTKETYNFGDGGKLTLESFKLSHHANGFVHFSKSGHEKAGIQRQSFRLADQRGLVCQLTLGPIEAFSEAGLRDKRKGRVYVPFIFSDFIPRAMMITVEWKPIAAVAELAPQQGSVGPLLQDGPYTRFFIGPPVGFPIQSHVLEVQCGHAPGLPNDGGEEFLTLLGGFDASHAASKNAHLGTGFLGLMYPISEGGPLPGRIPTVQRRTG